LRVSGPKPLAAMSGAMQ